MGRQAVTLETKRVTSKGKVYVYRVLRWDDPKTRKKRSETLGRADDRRHPDYISITDAKRLRDARALEFASKPGRRAGALTVASLVAWYSEIRRGDGTSAGTLKVDDFAGRLLIEHFGESLRIDRLYPADDQSGRANARDFVNRLNDGGDLIEAVSENNWKKPRWSTSTARKYLRNIRTMFNRATAEGVCDTNPFAAVGVTTSTAAAWTYIERRAFWQLYKAATPAWGRAIALARLAALSREDILTIEWSDIDWQGREIRIKRAKTGADQYVPIDDTLAKIMAVWRSGRGSFKIRGDRLIAPGDLSLHNLYKQFKVICDTAGVPRYAKPLHDLRKSCITDWAREHPPHVVQVWAGHKGVQTTMKFYTKMSPGDMERGKGPAYHRRAGLSPKLGPKPPIDVSRESG